MPSKVGVGMISAGTVVAATTIALDIVEATVTSRVQLNVIVLTLFAGTVVAPVIVHACAETVAAIFTSRVLFPPTRMESPPAGRLNRKLIESILQIIAAVCVFIQLNVVLVVPAN